jgi:hypothetical protein
MVGWGENFYRTDPKLVSHEVMIETVVFFRSGSFHMGARRVHIGWVGLG